MSDSMVKVLTQAMGLIDEPSRWAKGQATAGDVGSVSAKYCMTAAVRRVAKELGTNPTDALAALGRHVPGGHIEGFNDAVKTTHEDVMRAFRQALSAA